MVLALSRQRSPELQRLSEYGFVIDNPIKPPGIFGWMQKAGDISDEQMNRTFNMGMGYAYVVPEKSVACVTRMVPVAQVVGKVVGEPGAWLGELNQKRKSHNDTGPPLFTNRTTPLPHSDCVDPLPDPPQRSGQKHPDFLCKL